MASKKKLTRCMLLSVGVCMMISYGTFGMKVAKTSIQNVLPLEIIYKVLGEDKFFKKLIDDLNKKEEYSIKYNGCCCCRGNVLYAWVCTKGGIKLYAVYDLIYDALEPNKNNYVKLKEYLSDTDISITTKVYAYIKDNNVVKKLNDAIKSQTLQEENEMLEIMQN